MSAFGNVSDEIEGPTKHAFQKHERDYTPPCAASDIVKVMTVLSIEC